MSDTKLANLPKNQIQRSRNAIRRSWSSTEREQRRQFADAKQQRLYSILFAHRAEVTARVA